MTATIKATIKAIFLDQDGALADDPSHPAAVPQGVRRLHLRSGAGPALRLLARLDFRLFVVAGAASMETAHAPLQDLLFREQVTLDGYYRCAHAAGDGDGDPARACHCRKPMPGLLLRAAAERGIDLRASWMLGDRLHDVEAGNRAGCRTVLIDNGSETEWRLGPRRIPTRMAPDLFAAALLIASHGDAA